MAVAFPHFIGSEKASMENRIPLSPPVILTQDELKKIAAYKAVEFVESGMVLGLGTGSTAKHAVDRIGELLRQGKLKNIIGIPTSKKKFTVNADVASVNATWTWSTPRGTGQLYQLYRKSGPNGDLDGNSGGGT